MDERVIPDVPVGLPNSGSQCFANAGLQLLRSVVGAPDSLIDAVAERHPYLRRGQQDAHAWVLFAMELLYPQESPFDGRVEVRLQCAGCPRSRVYTELFRYLASATRQAAPGAPEGPEEVRLTCEQCGHGVSTQASQVHEWPEHLLVQVHRYNDTRRVRSGADTRHLTDRYDLVGYVIHKGNAHGGHYYSVVQSAGQWYHCDDAHVRACNPDNVDQAYLQMWTKKDRKESQNERVHQSDDS